MFRDVHDVKGGFWRIIHWSSFPWARFAVLALVCAVGRAAPVAWDVIDCSFSRTTGDQYGGRSGVDRKRGPEHPVTSEDNLFDPWTVLMPCRLADFKYTLHAAGTFHYYCVNRFVGGGACSGVIVVSEQLDNSRPRLP